MHAFASSRFIIRECSQRHGFAARLAEHRLRQQWRAIAGPFVAAHTRPGDVRFHKLHVAVENSVWLHQLTYLKRALLEKIQSGMKEIEIQDILFRIGDVPAPPADDADAADPADETAAPPPTPAARKTASACAQTIRDDALRESLTRVIAMALSDAARVKTPL